MTGTSSPDATILGAGIAGLSCARRLEALGLTVQVVDKSRGVGGRMATRRIGDATFDHGAQFFTVRSDAFRDVVDQATAAGSVKVWCNGFDEPADGYPRFCGTQGMTSLAKWLAGELTGEVRLGETVVDLHELPSRSYVLTAPVPQSLAVLSFSRLLPPPPLAIEMAQIAYKPTIAVLITLAEPATGMPGHGGIQFADDPDLAFISDNSAKGISQTPALTIHLSNERSGAMWDATDENVVAAALDLASQHMDAPAVAATQVQRWRYAGPVEVHPDPAVVWGTEPVVALAGEAFAGPKVEGAFLSGLAAADAIAATL